MGYRLRKKTLFILICMLFLSAFFSLPVFAAGPKKVAKIDRSLWPYSVNSAEAFDFASKMENFVFLEQFLETEKYKSEADLKEYLGLKKVSVHSVRNWRGRIWKILERNLNNANSDSPLFSLKKPVRKKELLRIVSELKEKMPDNLKLWYKEAKVFYQYYVYEQSRLAALFPRITSEIMKLDDSEVQGFERDDKSFIFTFDDGPSKKNGRTDKLIEKLRQEKINGVFFVLGSSLERRLKKQSVNDLKSLYEDMVLGSHGYIHKAHGKFESWEKSVKSTAALIRNIKYSEELLFRPPYGQRTVNVVNFLKEDRQKTVLWNIDSQDWNRKITAEETADRVITLMLLWRKGIILYHDVYSKAEVAVPQILKYFNGADLKFN